MEEESDVSITAVATTSSSLVGVTTPAAPVQTNPWTRGMDKRPLTSTFVPSSSLTTSSTSTTDRQTTTQSSIITTTSTSGAVDFKKKKSIAAGKHLLHINLLQKTTGKLRADFKKCTDIQNQLGRDLEMVLQAVEAEKIEWQGELEGCKLEKDYIYASRIFNSKIDIEQLKSRINESINLNNELTGKLKILKNNERSYLERINFLEKQAAVKTEELFDIKIGTSGSKDEEEILKELLEREDCITWVIATALMLGFLSLESAYLILAKFFFVR